MEGKSDLMFSWHGSLSQLARCDGAEGFEDALDVLLGEVRVDGGDVDAVEVLGLLLDVVDDHLSLRHVTRPSHFDVPPRYDDPIHLQWQQNSMSTLFRQH